MMTHSQTNAKPNEMTGLEAQQSSQLPAGWNTSRDLLVLFGAENRVVVKALLESGQQRIVQYLPPGESIAPHSPAPSVASHAKLMQHVVGLGGEAPALVHVKLLPGTQADEGQLESLGDTLGKALKSWQVNRSTLDNFGRLWLEQVVTNMAEVVLRPSIDELGAVFADRPCVIVSPGPSLEKNIEQLQELEGRALIMTCPHALQALDKAGIVPDIVVIGDARTLAWQYGDYDFSKVSALVLMASSTPELFDLPAKQIFTYGFSPDVDQWVYRYFGKGGFLSSGGSVACAELSLAIHLGCPQVAFIGQDLAFDGSRYYASSVRDGNSSAAISEDGSRFILERKLPLDRYNAKGRKMLPAPEQKVLDVPGYYGGLVKTSYTLSVFLDWFSVITKSEQCTSQVFNCTEGGAYIEGMVHLPLAQFRRRLTDDNRESNEVRIERAVLEWDKLQAHGLMMKSLARLKSELEHCRKTATTCLKLARAARGNESKLVRLSKEELRLTRELKSIPFLSVIAQAEIRSALEVGLSATRLADNLDASERLFKVVLKAVELVAPRVNASHRRLCAA